ncbi:hypothetical protein ACI2IX_10500 [Leifsonia aquatica]|uniref:hypothetical protein n=1 Tax=Leifsonia aquatica TaxID=144185 RepID=UPI00384BAE3F
MTSPRTVRPTRPVGIALLAATAALALAGCTPTAPAATPSTTAPPSPAATSTPAGSPAPSSASFGSCDTILPASALSGVDAGLAAVPSVRPVAGSYAAEIVSFGGIACQWTDAGDGTTLTVAVAQPSADQLSTAETALGGGAGTRTDAFGSDITAYTANGGGTSTGDIEVFTPAGYWVSAVSPLFTSADAPSAKTVISTVLQALPAG